MPQVEVHYHDGININTHDIFAQIERTIHSVDQAAGLCKSRGYKASDHMHKHIYIKVLLQDKLHRNGKFLNKLLTNLNNDLKKLIPKDCLYSIELKFLSKYYFTKEN